MRKFISLVMLFLPCTAFAGTDCRIVEYPDHYEAICTGNAEQSPASPQRTAQDQSPVQDQTVVAEQAQESEQADVPIVRNDLARQHAALWLRSRPGQ
jgi:hypothetical protein